MKEWVAVERWDVSAFLMLSGRVCMLSTGRVGDDDEDDDDGRMGAARRGGAKGAL
jgi:hypothetical protein